MHDAHSVAESPADARIGPEDRTRAHLYSMLARYLSEPPNDAAIGDARALTGGDTPLGRAIEQFANVARNVSETTVAEEFQDLFIGIGRGELVPYGSYYLTGFLHEKPLAKLREDMDRLGFKRRGDNREPEDHIASVLEMMAAQIDGRVGEPLSLKQQKEFFDRHIASWASHFFRDLAEAECAKFYAPLGAVADAFLKIEEEAFAMV